MRLRYSASHSPPPSTDGASVTTCGPVRRDLYFPIPHAIPMLLIGISLIRPGDKATDESAPA